MTTVLVAAAIPAVLALLCAAVDGVSMVIAARIVRLRGSAPGVIWLWSSCCSRQFRISDHSAPDVVCIGPDHPEVVMAHGGLTLRGLRHALCLYQTVSDATPHPVLPPDLYD